MNNLTNNFMSRIFLGTHDFSADVFKVALYTTPRSSSATAYTTNNEASGTGYTAGGEIVACTVGQTDVGTRTVTFDDVDWTGSFTIRSALIYNTSKANRTVASLSLGDTDLTIASQTITLRLSRIPILAVRSEE